MLDPSYGFDPLSLAEQEEQEEKSEESKAEQKPADPAPNPAAAMNETRINSIMGALKKIKALSKKPSLPKAFHEMSQGQKHRVSGDFKLLRGVYIELSEAVDIPLIAKVYKTKLTGPEKARFD